MAKREGGFGLGDAVRHKRCRSEEIGIVVNVEGMSAEVKWPGMRFTTMDPFDDLIHADSVINVQPEAEAAFVALAKALGYEVKKVD